MVNEMPVSGKRSQSSASDAKAAGSDFATTQWSLVLAAGGEVSPERAEALRQLCSRYWLPVYSYVRRRGRDEHEAQDLTQEFFARLLEREMLSLANPARGRFRSFLLTCLKRFLINQREWACAQKRGGGRPVLSLDFAVGQSQRRFEPVESVTPDQLYERQWALTLLDHVLDSLEREMTAAGKSEHFTVLKQYLTRRSGNDSYESAGRALGMSGGAAKVAAHRLRNRYRELVREEIAHTVSDPEEIEDEIRSLFAALGN
jgi:RNA polymerase sigma-70 factor (ECF subfamily)